MKLYELTQNRNDPWDDEDDEERENKKKYMKKFGQAFPHLSADGSRTASVLQQNVGMRVKYKLPTDKDELAKFLRRNGQVAAHGTFEIVGVQKDYNGDLCYRVRCVEFDGKEFNDTFGRVVAPDLVKPA